MYSEHSGYTDSGNACTATADGIEWQTDAIIGRLDHLSMVCSPVTVTE